MVDDAGLMPTLPEAATAPDSTAPAAPRSQARLASGAQIGRYTVTGVLGTGGMGVVYEATDRDLDRRVAIKLLRHELAGGGGQGRFLREAQAMARVEHPNVVAVHDVGMHDGAVFVAMELAPGKTLREWLGTPRTIAEVIAVFAAAGRGLAAAHAVGVVHRDVKPDNVIVGDDGRVRVTDFGLAQLPDLDPTQVTPAGQLAGTPAYMSPEQLVGEHVDARSDQFSFAIALYEALYAQRPFGGATIAELAFAVGKGKLRPPPSGSGVPSSLRAIVVRALSVKPGDRYATMDELLAALGRDRTRGWRAAAAVAGSLALAAATALVADGVARDRVTDDARAYFRAAGEQLDRALALRMEAFDVLGDVSSAAPDMREVTGVRAQATFGLGDEASDEAMFEKVHEAMRSADWLAFAREDGGVRIAIADATGRLVYTSAAPDQFGGSVVALPALEHALERGDTACVVRGDDPALLATGLTGGEPSPELVLVLAHTIAPDRVPRALFVQIVEARQLLADVTLGEGIALALAAPDGAITGDADPAVVRAALGSTAAELDVGDATWLVERRPLPGPDGAPIARLVMTRPLDVGLAGLFPLARVVLASLTLALLAVTAAAGLTARRRVRALAGKKK